MLKKSLQSLALLLVLLLSFTSFIFNIENVKAGGFGYIQRSYDAIDAGEEIFKQLIYVEDFSPNVDDSWLIICQYLDSTPTPQFEVAIYRTTSGSNELRLLLFDRTYERLLTELQNNAWYNVTFRLYYTYGVARIDAWVNGTLVIPGDYFGYYYPALACSRFGIVDYTFHPDLSTYKIYLDDLYQYSVTWDILVIDENFEGEFPGDWSIYGDVDLSSSKYFSPTHSLEAPATPASVSISPSSVHLVYNATATFTATVEGLSPPYSFQWYLDNMPVGVNADTFNYTAPFQDGVHHLYCNVTKDATQIKSNTAIITVSKYEFPEVIPLAYYPEFLIAGTSTVSTSSTPSLLVAGPVTISGTHHGEVEYHFSTYTGGTQRILNGGFETGQLSPWTLTGNATVTSDFPHSGSYSLYVAEHPTTITQQITPVYAYTISEIGFWFWVDGSPGYGVSVYLGVNYSDVGWRGYERIVEIEPTPQWVYLDFRATIRKDVEVKINAIKIIVTGAPCYIDDVTLVASTQYSETQLVNYVHFSCFLNIQQFGDPIYNSYVGLCGLVPDYSYSYSAGLIIQNQTRRFGLMLMYDVGTQVFSNVVAQTGHTYKIEIFVYINDRVELWIDYQLVLTRGIRGSLGDFDMCQVSFDAESGNTHTVTFSVIQVILGYVSIGSPPLYSYNGREFNDFTAQSKFSKVNYVSSAAWGKNEWVIAGASSYDWGVKPHTAIKGQFTSSFSALNIAPNTYISLETVDFSESEGYFLIGGTNYTNRPYTFSWDITPILVKYDGNTVTPISTPFSTITKSRYDPARLKIITQIRNCGDFWLISGKEGVAETLYKYNGTWTRIGEFASFADVTCIRWTGQYALISVGDEVYAYVNNELAFISRFPGKVYSLCWNNQYWLIGGQGFLAKFDGTGITYLNNQANIKPTDTIYSIAWNTHEWLIGGKSSSPLLLKYDGDNFYDLSSDLLSSGYPSNSYITLITDAFIYGIYYPIRVHPKEEAVTPPETPPQPQIPSSYWLIASLLLFLGLLLPLLLGLLSPSLGLLLDLLLKLILFLLWVHFTPLTQDSYCLPATFWIILAVITILGAFLALQGKAWLTSALTIPVILWLLLIQPKIPIDQMPITILRYFTVPPWHIIWAINLTVITTILLLSKERK